MKRIVSVLALCATMPFATPVAAQGVSGPYLAARQAFDAHDYKQAATYLSHALAVDQGSVYLRSLALQSFVALGDIDNAEVLARQLRAADVPLAMADLVGLVAAAQGEDFAAVASVLDDTSVGGAAMDGLLRGWAQMGQGQVRAALTTFETTADTAGVRAFALYQKGLALALVGDFEQALAVFDGTEGSPAIPLTERGALAKAQIMVQLDQRDAAADMLSARFAGTDNAAATALADRIRSGATLDFDFITSAQEGMGEVIFTIALALEAETDADLLLIYTRLAHHLAPRNIDALLLSAQLFEALGNPALATEAYDDVPRSHPAFLRAELGRAEALESSGRADAAVEVLAQLSETYPDIRRVQMSLGDLLRRTQDYDQAQRIYDRVIAGLDAPTEDDWFLYFARGVTHERLGTWPQAEADFRTSLDLNPNQPMVLNYLGYSFVDRGENLEEARDLIQRAVDGAPDRGYIIDSLGWVLFQLEDFDQAVIHLEDAVSKMPTDPVVNDHLGDAYWMVGRKTEARFQWRRAASFDPDPDVADRIARKLDLGLDVVRAEDSSGDVKVADDN